MRKLVLQMQMSVDGYVGSSAHPGWQLWNWGRDNRWDSELMRDFNAHFQALDTILLSRKMAEEGYLGHWARTALEHEGDRFYAFARRIGEVEKVVATDKLRQSRWKGARIVSGNLTDEVIALKNRVGSNIGVFGGAAFAAALIQAQLIDEFQFYINPAVLGSGARLFSDTTLTELTLIGAKAYACGMLVSRYRTTSLGLDG